MDLEDLLKEKASSGTLKVLVKSGAPRNAVLNYSEAEGYFKIAVAAPPKENRANLELVSFLAKLLGKKVRIKSGHASRRKTLKIIR
ncbi:MAG: DUF167 domain-containing protein [Candidatus Aenigmatarchaeota archaeon]